MPDQDILSLATDLRQELHRHPELSNQERWTKQRLIDFLHEHSSLEIIDKGAWFYAAYRAGADRKNIAFRADFDAIAIEEPPQLLSYASLNPGVSHKCGHDGHSASLAAFALMIDRHGADQNVFFLFQHAEETADGAIVCQQLIDDEQIDEIFAFHNMPGYPLHQVIVRAGTTNCASQGLIIELQGAPAHASQPETGRNPAFAIAEIIQSIPALIEPSQYRGLVLCTVIQVDIGAENFGIAASQGRLLLTLRAQYQDEIDLLLSRLKNQVEQLAARDHLAYSYQDRDVFPETANHPQSAAKVVAACRAAGIDVAELIEPQRGSEDFGYYLQKTPGAMFHIGAGDIAAVHTVNYDFPDALIATAVRVFSELLRLA